MVYCKKLYDTLGVEPSASEVDIKRAFKRTALKFHPDKTGNDPKSAELFKAATEAYEVLSDPDRRKTYDQFGVTEDAGGGGPGFGGVDLSDILGSVFGGGGHPFAHMFGGGGGRQQQQQQQRPQRRTDHANVTVTLSDVHAGAIKHIIVELPDMCTQCQGLGVADASDIVTCVRCNGNGVVLNQMGPFMAQSTCNSCFGKGRMIRPGRGCVGCRGEKIANTKRTFDVRLPKGIPNGHTHTIREKGAYNVDDKTHNDIQLTFVYAMPDGVDRVDENGNVSMNLKITLPELLCGFVRVISPWSTRMKVHTTGYFNPGDPIVFPGAGLPKYKKNSYGDITCKIEVQYPSTASFGRYTPVFSKALRLGGDEVAASDTNTDGCIDLLIPSYSITL